MHPCGLLHLPVNIFTTCRSPAEMIARSKNAQLIQYHHPYLVGSPCAGRARLLSILKPSEGGLLWRTAKADVAHELGLPLQHQHTSSLHFSAIERHFYSRQHAECSLRASSTISSQLLSQAAQGVAGQRRLTAAEEKKLLFPLLRLRQACCHPQVGIASPPLQLGFEVMQCTPAGVHYCI